MSASPIARQACSHAQAIPSKRVLVTDASQLPELYSSTPGGTLYSTTPGGETKRNFWLKLKKNREAKRIAHLLLSENIVWSLVYISLFNYGCDKAYGNMFGSIYVIIVKWDTCQRNFIELSI